MKRFDFMIFGFALFALIGSQVFADGTPPTADKGATPTATEKNDLITISPTTRGCKDLVNFEDGNNFGIESTPEQRDLLLSTVGSDSGRWVNVSDASLQYIIELFANKPFLRDSSLNWIGKGKIQYLHKSNPSGPITVHYEERANGIKLGTKDDNYGKRLSVIEFVVTYVQPTSNKDEVSVVKFSSKGDYVQLYAAKNEESDYATQYRVFETCGSGFGYRLDGQLKMAKADEINIPKATLAEDKSAASSDNGEALPMQYAK